MVTDKQQLVIDTAENYPTASERVLAKLCDIDIRTVSKALELKEAQFLKKPIEPKAEYENDVDLLVSQLRKLCKRENPDVQALRTLSNVLEKTGKLNNYNMEDEELLQHNLDTLTPAELTSIAMPKSISQS